MIIAVSIPALEGSDADSGQDGILGHLSFLPLDPGWVESQHPDPG
jgi:hypothetical protein